MLAYFGVDLLEDRHSLRRLHNLITRLPATSEYAAERDGVDPADRLWTTTDYLLAAAIDILQVSVWQFAAAHAKVPPRKPKPIPRPRDMAAKQRHRKTGPTAWPGRTIVVPKEAPWQAATSASASPTSTSDSVS